MIAVWGTGRVQAFANTGFPVDFIYPKEGAPILLASACPVAKATINPLAHEFIKTLISAPVQTVLAKEMGNGPVNTKVDVNMPELRMAPVGERAKLVIRPTGTPSTPSARTGPSAGTARSSAERARMQRTIRRSAVDGVTPPWRSSFSTA